MRKTIRLCGPLCGLLVTAISLVMLPANPASATNIPAGFDLFTTQQTPASSYNFASDPIPADFFGPGSEPFGGVVLLGGAVGGADTIVQRMNDMILDPPSGGTVPIELVQLNLVSCAPITVTYSAGGPVLWDVWIEKNPGPPNTGGMTINKTHANGGTFTSNLVVNPVFTFTRVGAPLITTAPLIRQNGVTGTGFWNHTAPPNVVPTTNNFYPGVDELNNLHSVFYQGGGLSLELRLTTVPEPATLALLAVGGVAALRRGRYRLS